ncbi:MAG: TIGR04086 family membrane protein [Clostridia bacterium]|nr:TIGR04086 family membrane protein [Clostridia bacterium]
MLFSSESKASLVQVVRGVVTAVLITLIGVLVFSLVLFFTDLGDGVIRPVNQIIKLLAIFFGAFLAVKEDKFFIKGGLIGLLSTLFTFLIFALISGGLSFGWGLLIDLVFGFLMGALSGLITGRIRRF